MFSIWGLSIREHDYLRFPVPHWIRTSSASAWLLANMHLYAFICLHLFTYLIISINMPNNTHTHAQHRTTSPNYLTTSCVKPKNKPSPFWLLYIGFYLYLGWLHGPQMDPNGWFPGCSEVTQPQATQCSIEPGAEEKVPEKRWKLDSDHLHPWRNHQHTTRVRQSHGNTMLLNMCVQPLWSGIWSALEYG